MRSFQRKPFLFIAVLTLSLTFNNFLTSNISDAQVRTIYFVPKDRTPNPQIHVTVDQQMKAVQAFYAKQMNTHGYGQKTFKLETFRTGKVITHQIIGKHTEAYYFSETLHKVRDEIQHRFNTPNDILVIFVDLSNQRVNGNCGIAQYAGGPVLVPASGECIEGDEGIDLISHELGHAFNLLHDFRDDTHIMSYGYGRNKLSKCAATYLNVSPYFNGRRPASDSPTITRMISGKTPPRTGEWEIQFAISDTDGLYQVQLEHGFPNKTPGIIECQRIQGTSANVTLTMPSGATLSETNNIWLRVVDTKGNTQTQDFLLTSEVSEGSEDIIYLTLSVSDDKSLKPTNSRGNWDGWLGHIWEKKPNGHVTDKPPHYLSHQYEDVWDNWFYAHAESKITYDISTMGSCQFEAWFHLAHTCSDNNPPASMEFIALVDDTRIYSSGIKKGSVDSDRNTHITFEIPEDYSTLTIQVSSGTDGGTCDHFVIGNPRLIHRRTPTIQTSTPTTTPTDVNGDGTVNIVDIVMVSSRYGERITGNPTPNPDVNRDGIVDIDDLILVCAEVPIAAAPPLLPITTQLLPNYPNPCNPETWIPYLLKEATDVKIEIYAVDGRLVRTLPIGFQEAGVYVSRDKASYWDGRNTLGEPVASGLYFYTLFTGTFAETRKIWVQK